MKKLLLLSLLLLVGFTLAACADEGEETERGTLILYQNKVEIDDVLADYADAWGAENNVNVRVKTCGGSGCAYPANLATEFASRDEPDIFVFEGLGQYLEYQNKILDLTGEEWIDDTDVAYTYNGKVYGFPINLEGWGMAYNADILEAAGIDPDTLVNRAGYEAAFQTLEANKATLGIEAPVSMGAGSGLTWVTGLHNFNGYLSSGLDYDDRTVIEALLDGEADMDRLNALADWVELLFDYAWDQNLIDGDYDAMINAFKLGRTAFVHQGNWIDPNLLDGDGIDFEVGYAPHASGIGDVDSIFVGAPSYYAVNTDGNNIELAKQFLNDMALTAAGHDYMVNKAKMVPAFNSVELVPDAPLSAEVLKWAQEGKIYAWWQNDMPPGFGMDDLGAIYMQFAQGNFDKAEFVQRLKVEIEALGD